MQPGEPIGERFVIERLAAEGGMGAVYRARDLHTDGLAAIKVVRTSDAHSLERFAREARVLAELRHPGFVHYLAHGRSDRGELYLAMEWLEGEDLERRLASRELTVAETVELITQVAAALATAHVRGVVHRDLKPSNLFLVDYRVDRVKVLDFGVARLVHQDDLTATGAIVGTPRFMAPEQARGAKGIDARADVFALGAVLFRCLTGEHAFSGDTPAELLGRILHDEAPRVRDLAPALPPELDDLVARMLAKAPATRPPDAAAVLAAALGLQPTDATSPRVAMTDHERRVRCVLVLGTEVGADDAAARAVVATHGGTLDGAIVTIASHRVATDQARLAARCALALREHVDAPMALVMGRLAHTIDAVAAARRLLGAPRSIRLDAATAGLLDAQFTVTGDGHGLCLHAETVDDEARTLLGKPTPFVGRDQELAQLEAIVGACATDGEARAVLVTAPPGLGKSRLRQELAKRLRDHYPAVELWIGRGDPMRAGSPFGLLGEAIRHAAAIDGSEPLPTRRRLLRERVERHVPAARVEHVAAFLGELAGVPFPADDDVQLRTARRDPLLLADQMRGAWEEWLTAESEAHPIVIALEDLHWGDLPTVKFIDGALAALAERPLVVLGLARPEVHDLFPRIWAERRLQIFSLGELSRKACERLARQILGDVPDPIVARIVERSSGNVFYLEELIRQVATGDDASLPETVLAMVEVRLHALPPEIRRVMRAASVFGEVFWGGGVEALLGTKAAHADEHLQELAEREVVRRRDRSRFAGEQEYTFRHGLMREAAYAMLTDGDRGLGHHLAGTWLEQAGERDALVVAEHYERGHERGRAVIWYRRAAEQALAGDDIAASIERAEKGLACGADGEARGLLRLLQADCHGWRGENDLAATLAATAMDALVRGSDAWFDAAGEAAAALGKLNRVAELRALADELREAGAGRELDGAYAVALARTSIQCSLHLEHEHRIALNALLRGIVTTEPRVAAWIDEALAYEAFIGSDPETAVVHHLRAADHYARAGDLRRACMQQIDAADALLAAAAADEAERVLATALPAAERMRLPAATQFARALQALALGFQGRTAAALTAATAAVERLPSDSHPRVASFALLGLGLALQQTGDLAGAERRLREAVACAYTPMLSLRVCLARVRLELGDAVDAIRIAEAALAEMRDFHYWQSLAELVLAEAHHALGDATRARAALVRAREAMFEGLSRLHGAAWRQNYLELMPGNARIAQLARSWLAEDAAS